MASKKTPGILLNNVGDLLATFDTTFFPIRCEMKNKIGVSYWVLKGAFVRISAVSFTKYMTLLHTYREVTY